MGTTTMSGIGIVRSDRSRRPAQDGPVVASDLAALTGAAAPSVVASPEQRWRQALRQRPLETPRSLPPGLDRLSRSVSGRTGVRYTTGAATAAALEAAGAQAASSGDVVHLPAVPSAQGAAGRLLLHELAHLRQPLARPRFLLQHRSGSVDADEQHAVRAAEVAGAAVQRLLVPGAPATTPGAANALSATSSTTSSTTSSSTTTGAPTVRRLADPTRSAAGSVARLASGAGVVSPDAAAGVVADLPVASGASGAVLDAVRGIARQEVAALTQLPASTLQDRAASALAQGLGAGGSADGLAAVGGPSAPTVAGATSPPVGFGEPGPEGAFDLSAGAAAPVDGGAGAVSGGAPAMGVATPAGGASTGGASTGATGAGALTGVGGAPVPEPLLDGVVEALEQRLLAELERRGGRYSGVF
jgi:hypothetical protein